jgi:hypothetical protein
LVIANVSAPGWAWHDETHLAIAKAAGYAKWYNAAGADMAKIRAGDIEARNHYSGNPPQSRVTVQMVFDQVARYNRSDDANGHLYGAIIAALRDYQAAPETGKYAQYHLAFCAHYVGDLSQPLHNTRYNDYNKRHHNATDGVIEAEVMANLASIRIYPITIRSEADLAVEIARIATLSLQLGDRLEAEGRMLTRAEAYGQISHSASLFKAMLTYLDQ